MNHISHGDIEMSVSPHGAELQSIRFQGKEYLYQKVAGFWQRQSPILFPIVGKLREDSYISNGKQYFLPQHGFLRDMQWKMERVENNEIRGSVKSSTETKEKYPWDFAVIIRYIIETTALRVEYTVSNNSVDAMPVSLGGHPAFHIEGNIRDYSVEFENDDEILEYDILDQEQKGLLSGHTGVIRIGNKTLPLSEELFHLDALIFRNLQSERMHLQRNGKRVFTFNRGNFPHFALWKQPHAPFLCFEPWQGYADSTETQGDIQMKPGMVSLLPGESRTWEWLIDFS